MPKAEYRREIICFATLVTLSFLRFSFLGFRYTPYLDDHIQYIFYPSLDNGWDNILAGGARILATRPLAGIFDYFLWSRFSHHLGVAVALISIIHGLSAIFFYKAFRHIDIELGLIFFIFYLFLPSNSEGTYWLSASTRIVVSLFFISVSLMFAAKEKTTLFTVFSFLSMWFYEQTAILSLFCAVMFFVISKDYLKIVIPSLSFALLIFFYLWVGTTGDNAHRFSMVHFSQLLHHSGKTISSIVKAFIPVTFQIIKNGFMRSVNTIFENLSYLWFAVIGALSICVVILAKENQNKTPKAKMLYGIILAISPMLPFFVTNNEFALRNLVPCLLGVAIVLDGIVPLLLKSFTPIFASVCLIVFSVATASETIDYEKTARHDVLLAQKISENVTHETKQISVKITTPVYLPQNAVFGDHIKSMVGSDWGVMGIVRTVSGNHHLIVDVLREKQKNNAPQS